MRNRVAIYLCACAAGLSLTSVASAQLVVGTNTPSPNTGAFYRDVTAGTNTALWPAATQKTVFGMAADTTNGRIFSSAAARLNVWNYGQVGTVGTAVGNGMYRTDGTTFTATGIDGLGWANGTLYGSATTGTTLFKRGIYSINLTPDANNRLILSPVWEDPNTTGTWDLQGLEFNAADGMFYGTNVSENVALGVSRGLFRIDAFGDDSITKIADFPAGTTNLEGLAIGGGKFWLTDQDPASSGINVYPLDMATLTYDPSFTIPQVDATNRASGATWAPGALNAIPEPTSLAAIGLAGIAISVRRRRA